MSEATLSPQGDGRWTLAGSLDFATVPGAWSQLEKLLRAGGPVTLSLGGVTQANSAALALLLEARDLARRSGSALRLVEVPAELLDLARMSQCETLLDVGAA